MKKLLSKVKRYPLIAGTLATMLGVSAYEVLSASHFTYSLYSHESAQHDKFTDMLNDYEIYKSLTIEKQISESVNYIKKYQTIPLAYHVYTQMLSQVRYEGSITLNNNENLLSKNLSTIKITPQMKSEAQEQAQKIVAIYSINRPLMVRQENAKILIRELQTENKSIIVDAASAYLTSYDSSLYVSTVKQMDQSLSALQDKSVVSWGNYREKIKINSSKAQ